MWLYWISVALVVGIVAYAITALVYKPGLKGISGPRQLPLIGNLLNVVWNRADPLDWLVRCTGKVSSCWWFVLPPITRTLTVALVFSTD
jgi:hypothetical protein